MGGARCLYPPLEPSHKEVLWEGWIPSIQVLKDAQAEGSVSTKASSPPGSSEVPWQVWALHPGATLSQPPGSGAWRAEGWDGTGGGPGSAFTGLSSPQGEQDDRSYKQCRASSPSSTGSVSLGRYTPTSRSPQHCSRPGTCPHPSQLLLPP